MNSQIVNCLLFLLAILLFACQQEEIDTNKTIVYSDSIYTLKQYKVERHPTILRNGFGMDIYHEGDASKDTSYLKSDTASFKYDLLFYNEMTYFPLSTGDYSSSGNPAIFMYADKNDASQSVRAVMVGQGISCFNNFNADSIAKYVSDLKSDNYFNISDFRTVIHSSNVNGSLLLQTTADSLYKTLVIGYKFRPNIGGVFNMSDVSDETQINYQPVFLIRTREGLYAKFMVTRFKGVGVDTQKLTLQWQALKTL